MQPVVHVQGLQPFGDLVAVAGAQVEVSNETGLLYHVIYLSTANTTIPVDSSTAKKIGSEGRSVVRDKCRTTRHSDLIVQVGSAVFEAAYAEGCGKNWHSSTIMYTWSSNHPGRAAGL